MPLKYLGIHQKLRAHKYEEHIELKADSLLTRLARESISPALVTSRKMRLYYMCTGHYPVRYGGCGGYDGDRAMQRG